MIAVVDRIVQFPHRYQLRNVATGEILGTFDLDPVLGTVQVGGTKINKELFDSIAADIDKKVSLNGGELKDTIVTFNDYSGTANIVSGEKASIMMAKIKKKLNDHDNFIATKGKPNGFASLDGNGKVNETAKKAVADNLGNVINEHYATKKDINESMKVVKDCKDEVGITGYKGCSEGLAFESAKSVFELPMINGQTGRASENLFDYFSGYNIKDCSYKVVEENGQKIFILNITGPDPYIEKLSTVYFPLGKYTLYYDSDNSSSTFIRIEDKFRNIKNGEVYNFELTTTGAIIFRFDGIEKQSSGTQKFYNIALYKGTYTKETLPSYKKFDDRLVNSHCVVKTTGVNLCDEDWKVDGKWGIISKNFCPITPNTRYVLTSYKGEAINIDLFDSNFNKIDYWGTRDSVPFTTQNNIRYFKINSQTIVEYGTVYKHDIMLSYGTKPQPYTPHTEDVIADIGELGKNDSIDNVNKKKYIRQSPIINLGNQNWGYRSDYSAFKLELKDILEVSNTTVPDIIHTTKYKVTYFSSATNMNIFVDRKFLYIQDDSFNGDVSAFKESLKNKYLSYVLDTITEIDMSSNPLPFTMRIEKGGMELQEPIGNALPYNLTKIYSINKSSQIDANSSANARQNEEISALESRASSLENATTSLENNKADTTYVDEELTKKQPTGDYATKEELTNGLAGKQPNGDYATRTELSEGLATKQPSGNYQPAGDYATNTALNDGLATKQNNLTEKQISDINDIPNKASSTELANGLATKLGSSEQATDSAKLGGVAASSYALKTDIPTKTSELTNDSNFITDISGKADKGTTLAEYGITDAKIDNGVITLGGNTITPITNVSGKQDKEDNSLETTSKNVVGAINELNTNKANVGDVGTKLYLHKIFVELSEYSEVVPIVIISHRSTKYLIEKDPSGRIIMKFKDLTNDFPIALYYSNYNFNNIQTTIHPIIEGDSGVFYAFMTYSTNSHKWEEYYFDKVEYDTRGPITEIK